MDLTDNQCPKRQRLNDADDDNNTLKQTMALDTSDLVEEYLRSTSSPLQWDMNDGNGNSSNTSTVNRQPNSCPEIPGVDPILDADTEGHGFIESDMEQPAEESELSPSSYDYEYDPIVDWGTESDSDNLPDIPETSDVDKKDEHSDDSSDDDVEAKGNVILLSDSRRHTSEDPGYVNHTRVKREKTYNNGVELLVVHDSHLQEAIVALDLAFGWLDEERLGSGMIQSAMEFILGGCSSSLASDPTLRKYLESIDSTAEIKILAEHSTIYFKTKPRYVNELIAVLARHLTPSQIEKIPVLLYVSIAMSNPTKVDLLHVEMDDAKHHATLMERYILEAPGENLTEALEKNKFALIPCTQLELIKKIRKIMDPKYLKLVVLTPKTSLSSLEQMCRRAFSPLQSLDVDFPEFDQPHSHKSVPHFENLRRGEVIELHGQEERCSVFFYIPDERCLLDTQPSMYYIYLLNSHSQGSLYWELRESQSFEDLSCRYEHRREGVDVLRIDIKSSQWNEYMINDVINAVYAYVDVIAAAPVTQQVFDEMVDWVKTKQILKGKTMCATECVELVQTTSPRYLAITNKIPKYMNTSQVAQVARHLSRINSSVLVTSKKFERKPLVPGWKTLRAAVDTLPYFNSNRFNMKYPGPSTEPTKQSASLAPKVERREAKLLRCKLFRFDNSEHDSMTTYFAPDGSDPLCRVNLKISRFSYCDQVMTVAQNMSYAEMLKDEIMPKARQMQNTDVSVQGRRRGVVFRIVCPFANLFTLFNLLVRTVSKRVSLQGTLDSYKDRLLRIVEIDAAKDKMGTYYQTVDPLVSDEGFTVDDLKKSIKEMTLCDIQDPYKGRVELLTGGNITGKNTVRLARRASHLTSYSFVDAPESAPVIDSRRLKPAVRITTARRLPYIATIAYSFNDYTPERWAVLLMLVQVWKDTAESVSCHPAKRHIQTVHLDCSLRGSRMWLMQNIERSSISLNIASGCHFLRDSIEKVSDHLTDEKFKNAKLRCSSQLVIGSQGTPAKCFNNYWLGITEHYGHIHWHRDLVNCVWRCKQSDSCKLVHQYIVRPRKPLAHMAIIRELRYGPF